MPDNRGFITIKIQGVRTTTRRLATWGARITDLRIPFEQIGLELLDDFMHQILWEGGTLGRGSSWKPLARSTVRDRIRKGYEGEHPIMWRTGLLLRSLAGRGQPGNVFNVAPTSLEVGSDVFYAGWQHFGTSRIPARQLVGIKWRRRMSIIARLNQYIQQEAAAQGFLPGGV